MRQFLLTMIRFYQRWFSPMLGANCRFYPSCSCYAHDAIAKHGPAKGSLLSVRRLLRCHPWHSGGYDPVPNVQTRLHQ
jgi:uncharacterized protein